MTHWDIYESSNIYVKLNNPDVKIGDTIEYHTNNQEGLIFAQVIINENGEKSLNIIATGDIFEDYYLITAPYRIENRKNDE